MTWVRCGDELLEDNLIYFVDACDQIGIYSRTHSMAVQLVGTVANLQVKNYQVVYHIKSTVVN